jgi:hypothetical protein
MFTPLKKRVMVKLLLEFFFFTELVTNKRKLPPLLHYFVRKNGKV